MVIIRSSIFSYRRHPRELSLFFTQVLKTKAEGLTSFFLKILFVPTIIHLDKATIKERKNKIPPCQGEKPANEK